MKDDEESLVGCCSPVFNTASSQTVRTTKHTKLRNYYDKPKVVPRTERDILLPPDLETTSAITTGDFETVLHRHVSYYIFARPCERAQLVLGLWEVLKKHKIRFLQWTGAQWIVLQDPCHVLGTMLQSAARDVWTASGHRRRRHAQRVLASFADSRPSPQGGLVEDHEARVVRFAEQPELCTKFKRPKKRPRLDMNSV